MSRGEGGGLEVRPSHLDRHTGRGRRAGESTARDDIFAAARELFSASGFDRTTMRAVAERAGVDPALISHYFGSKQGLFLAATEFPADPQEVLRPLRTCPHDEIGATALRAIITVWDSPAGTAVVDRFRQAVVADKIVMGDEDQLVIGRHAMLLREEGAPFRACEAHLRQLEIAEAADRRVDLVAEGLDLAIRLGPARDEALIARRLCEHGRIVCAAPAYLARHGTPATPADLARHNCILFDQPEYLNQWPFRRPDGTVERVRVRGTARSDSGDALHQLLLNGIGIARAADFLALPDLASGRLVRVLEPFTVDERTPIHAVYPQRRHLPAKVRVFVDFLVEQLGPVPPWERDGANSPTIESRRSPRARTD